MPVDMAIRICLASSPPLHSFLSNRDNHRYMPAAMPTRCQPLRPCLSPESCSPVDMATTSSSGTITESCVQVRKRRSQKKRVVFADSQGLVLTTVHVFTEPEDDRLAELQFQLTEMEGATEGLHLEDLKDSTDFGLGLVLDFTPPAADYLELRNRLKAQHVCLETCSVQDHLLSGTIQVENVCFEKSVLVRITFDSWNFFQDVDCRYLNNVYGCPDTDTFAFSVSVPQNLDSSSRVEFCIRYQTHNQTFWDNNLGNNYGLTTVDPNGCPSRVSKRSARLEIQRDNNGEKVDEMDYDPLGSPRTLVGVFPKWQSWGRVETSAPYW
uniref:Protein phosphatase 1 regulatory subunit n=1 Tax=Nothobranchius kadleci TaxID=1051664 RepID=A0A1A8BW51_NOTKA